MFVSPEKFFTEKVSDFAAFKLEKGSVSFGQMKKDVARYASHFAGSKHEDFILYVEGDAVLCALAGKKAGHAALFRKDGGRFFKKRKPARNNQQKNAFGKIIRHSQRPSRMRIRFYKHALMQGVLFYVGLHIRAQDD